MAKVAVIMGSASDYETLQHTGTQLEQLNIPFDMKIISAHRTPDLLFSFCESAKDQGYAVIIAGAGGAAHLPGMAASKTSLPVIGVPIDATVLKGLDALYSIVQMPAGVPVATLAIGKPGAINAGILAAQILALSDNNIAMALDAFRKQQTQKVLDNSDPRKA